MAQQNFQKGTTSKLTRIFIQNSTTGAPITGLVYNSSGLQAYYIKEGDSSTTVITLATAVLGTWTSGGFKEVDSTNMPGIYEFGVPNAAIATTNSCFIYLTGATSMAPCQLLLELEAVNNQDAVHYGLGALPNASYGSAGGIPAQTIRGGTAQAGAASTITLDASASATNNLYNNQVIFISGGTGAGQSNIITSYVGATKVATVANAWAVTPDNTSVFVIMATGPSTATVSGTVNANLTQILGTAVSTPATAGILDVNVKNIAGTVSAGAAGYMALDWAHINAPTTVQNLSGTTISVTQAVASVSGAVGSVTGNVGGVTGVTFPSTVASPTNITAGTITTVTNLTNAPTVGDLTATMKASVTTAATAATPTAAAVTTPVTISLSQAIPTSNTVQTIGDALNAARAQGFGKWTISGTTITLYAGDGTTVVRTFTLDSSTAPTQRT